MVSSQTFYFSIGPVQEFVAQTRRTRDLWAGSYILSYLAGIALKTVVDAGGEILFPVIDEDFMFLALTASSYPSTDDYKEIGSLPNRFKAKADNPSKVAQLAACEVYRAWEKIGQAVWNKFSEKVTCNNNIEDIWKRQVENQWEINWVIGDEGYPIGKRKNIRIHLPEDEPGEKCTICGERQALSPNGEDDRRWKVTGWWTSAAKQFNGERRGFHFRDDGSERLCAVCTIKRIFPLVTIDAIVTKATGKGWDVSTKNYPSTTFMSAVPWLISLLKKVKDGDVEIRNALNKFVETAKNKEIPYDEKATVIKTLNELATELNLVVISDFIGDVFFEDRLKDEKEFKLNDTDRDELLNALKSLYESANSKPHPYYALLIMDGDNMGALLSKYEQDKVSTALSHFNKLIKTIADDANGKLIYGGGDDVMALLPVETALDCAERLRNEYSKSFRTYLPEIKDNEGTISAGIIYSHMTTPLQSVVSDAHNLLNETAKKETGRDAFAVRVWKRGGPILTFSRKWENNVAEIMKVKKMFAKGQVSTGFIFHFKELLQIMEIMGDHEQRLKLLVAEYLKSREELELPDDINERLKEAKERMEKIYDLSLSPEDKLDSAALFFIRFLRQMEENL